MFNIDFNYQERESTVLIQSAQTAEVMMWISMFFYLFIYYTVGENLTKATQNPDKIWSLGDWSVNLHIWQAGPTQPNPTLSCLHSIVAQFAS